MQNVVLNNGLEMPILGFGVWTPELGEAEKLQGGATGG